MQTLHKDKKQDEKDEMKTIIPLKYALGYNISSLCHISFVKLYFIKIEYKIQLVYIFISLHFHQSKTTFIIILMLHSLNTPSIILTVSDWLELNHHSISGTVSICHFPEDARTSSFCFSLWRTESLFFSGLLFLRGVNKSLILEKSRFNMIPIPWVDKDDFEKYRSLVSL